MSPSSSLLTPRLSSRLPARDLSRPRWRASGVLGPLGLAALLLLPACGGDEAELAEAVVSVDPQAEAVQVAEQFDQTLRALSQRYQFTTTATNEIDGSIASQIVGRNVAGGSISTTNTAATATVIDIVGVGAQFWTRTNGAEWVIAEAAPFSHDPLASLFAVTQVSMFEGRATITYPGAALGLAIDWVSADLEIVGPTIELTSVVDGVAISSTLSPAVDLTPILAPV